MRDRAVGEHHLSHVSKDQQAWESKQLCSFLRIQVSGLPVPHSLFLIGSLIT